MVSWLLLSVPITLFAVLTTFLDDIFLIPPVGPGGDFLSKLESSWCGFEKTGDYC